MPTKLDRKIFPYGLKETDFVYMGRPSKDQNDFGNDVGLADMVCVDQFGEKNSSKFYHSGVVQAQGKWFVYLEWGRVFSGKSWTDGYYHGQDYQFVECSSEEEARKFFFKQSSDKNTKRIEEKTIGGKTLWVGKNGKDGYIVQDLAVREKGLPDAYKIKDSSGIVKETKKEKSNKDLNVIKVNYSHHITSLVSDLVGGTKSFARSVSASTGIYPTKATIDKVRDDLLPLAMTRLSVVGNDINQQLLDQELIDISTLVATLVPRPIPLGGSKLQRQMSVVLSSDNIVQIQNDLDAFESALKNEDFDEEDCSNNQFDPHETLLGNKNCEIVYLDEGTKLHQWVKQTFLSMSNNRHYDVRNVKIKNIFEVRRPDRDVKFKTYVSHIADKRSNIKFVHKARLQPNIREENDLDHLYDKSNSFIGIHGTKSIYVAPILQTNLRLPKYLSGVQITGAMFGGGIYFATDWKKSAGYLGSSGARYGSGGGISNRGNFMFLADVVMGDAYMPKQSGNYSCPPDSKDSIAAYPEICRSLQNDEHIVFDENSFRIRYLIELNLNY